MKFILLSFMFLAALASAAQDLTFKVRGKTVKTLTLTELKKLVSPELIAVRELHDATSRSYRGFPFVKLMKAVYGESIKGFDEILFTCLDGYQPSLPYERFKKHEAFLVFDGTDGKFGYFDKQKKTKVDYGPFYLVWENIKDPILYKEGNEGWPYQVTTVDLVQFSDRFAGLAPLPGASEDVKSGFVAYRTQCQQCHTINGQGGDKGIELNYPVNVTEYFEEKWLLKWISDPTSVRFNAKMPKVNPDLPDREKTLKNIVAYLKAMTQNKIPPKP